MGLFLALLIVPPAIAEDKPSVPDSPGATAAGKTIEPRETAKPAEISSSHKFFDRKNVWLFSGIAVMRTLDYTSTRNMQARGREEILLPDDVAKNDAAFAAVEVAGAAASIGISYWLHRTGHHKLERWLSIGHISVAGFGAARNYALPSKHP